LLDVDSTQPKAAKFLASPAERPIHHKQGKQRGNSKCGFAMNQESKKTGIHLSGDHEAKNFDGICQIYARPFRESV
jgi:hypothetical protein